MRAWSGGLGAAMSTATPIFPVTTARAPIGTMRVPATTPVMMRELKQWRTDEYRSINNLKMSYRPIENLTLTLSGSYDYMRIIEDVYEPWQIIELLRMKTGEMLFERHALDNYNVFATATYLHRLNENSVFTYMMRQKHKRASATVIPMPMTTIRGRPLRTTSM